MPENKFEKQVQHKLYDFGIKPSAEVWNYIEPRIQVKRRRRWLIFPVFVLITIATGSYLYLQNNKAQKNQPAIASAQNIQLPDENSTNKDRFVNNNNISTIPEIKKENSSILFSKQQQENEKQPKAHAQKLILVPLKSLKSTPHSADFLLLEKGTVYAPSKTASQNNFETGDKKVKNTTEENIEITRPGIAATNPEAGLEKNITDTITVLTNAAPEKSGADKLAQTNKAIHISRNTFNKKINFGFSASYGFTNVWENFAGIAIGDNPASLDFSLSAGSIGVSYFNSNAAKSIRPKSAWSAGIELRKQISARSALISGINFTHLKTEIETGISVSFGDTALSFNNIAPAARINSIYKTGAGNVYTNHFYLLQVPLLYEYKLGFFAKAPLYAYAGLSANALLSTNMILYDSYNLAYYNNNQLLNKFILNMHFGMSVQVIDSKKMSGMLGPQIQYGLTNLLKNKNYGQQHMVQYGIKASLFFK